MAEPRKDDHLVDSFSDDETRDTEQEHVRSSNDSEEQERAGRDHDEAVGQGTEEDIDPDRAESDVDRDDSSVE